MPPLASDKLNRIAFAIAIPLSIIRRTDKVIE